MKDVLRELLKKAYFSIPFRYRPRIFALVFRVPIFRRLLTPFLSQSFHASAAFGPGPFHDQLFNSRGKPNWAHSVAKLRAFHANGLTAAHQIKIGVAVHAYYLDLLPGILRMLENIPSDFNLYVTAPAENIEKVQRLISNAKFPTKVIEVENSGYDLLPFIKVIPQFIADDIDVICKVHTKKGGANLDDFYPGIGAIWSKLLLNPILSSAETVADILSAFESDADLAMIGSASLYKSAENLMYGNQGDVIRILGVLDNCKQPIADWGFFAGSMFWSRVESLKSLLQLLNEKAPPSVNSTGQNASYWHAAERVLGLLPTLANQKVGLSFATNVENTSHVIAILDHEQQRLLLNRFGVGLTLATERSIENDLACLKSTLSGREFSPSTAGDLGMDSVLYYLRYGIFLGQELVDSFNSLAYWHVYKDVFTNRLNPLVHYMTSGQDEDRVCFPANDNIEAACRIIERSDTFDRNFYLSDNPAVAIGEADPLRHFCEFGWLELRDPSSDFDIWNYWQQNLDPRTAIINPAVHKVVLQSQPATQPKKKKIQLSDGYRFTENQEIRRICLFAGYDPEDVIDQTVIDYVSELSRFADVYYLSDGEMRRSELQKLDGIVKGAWSFRHRAYDFGSYSKLALNLVGWDRIEQYDELILANDSCYLIKPFDPVFEKMRRSKCDWWGLQATKGVGKTKWKASNRFAKNVPLEEVKANKLDEYETEDFYDFLIASYFLVFRRPVILGPELKEVLTNVRPELNKLNIIRKYEIGLTRKLINSGYNFDTYIGELFTFHPIFTENHFELIKQGFPLFKRFFLTENHYHVPELWRWEERLLAEIPDLNLAPIKSNLLRVSNPEKLHRNLHIRALRGKRHAYPKLLSNVKFAWRDRSIKKNENWWAFPVCAYDHNLTGNDRAIFEFVKNDATIKKIVLVREKNFEASGKNVEIVPLKSLEGQSFLIRSKIVFVKHTLSENVGFPLNPELHHLINLWHGVPLKRIGYCANDLQDRLQRLKRIHAKFRAVICSSEIDRMAMACAFYPLTYNDMWLTGLPRIDFILQDESLLPADMIGELRELEEIVDGRRLILFCPTFRNEQEKGYYQFSQEEKNQLKQLMLEHNFVLGIREHMATTSAGYLAALVGLPTLDLGVRKFKNVEMIYRKAQLLLTDYSSCFIDFMVTGRPVISFAYDYENYVNHERGLFYDLPFAVPGPICTTFVELISALKAVADTDAAMVPQDQYEFKRKLFHKYMDGRNTERVVNMVKNLNTQRGTSL